MAKRKKFPIFWCIFAAFVVVMIIFWFSVIGYVKKCLVIYEDSQPQYVVSQIVDSIHAGEISAYMDFEGSVSKFENANLYRDEYLSKVTGSELTFEKSPNSYDASKPVYNVYSGDDKVAEIALECTKQTDLMFILSVQEWKVASVSPVYDTRNLSVSILVPDSYKVYVNNILLSASELTGNTQELNEFAYAKAYVAVPYLVEYEVSGLANEPKVEVFDANDRAVEYEMKDGKILVSTFASMQMPSELESFCLNNAKTYSNYFSKDIEGCFDSINPIRYMFPSDSYYLELAEVYRTNDMWMYSAHQAPVFTNVKVGNYIQYSPDLFSCDISFDKEMILTLNGQTRVDSSNTRYYYVNIDGSWKIADMKSVIVD